MDRDESFLAGSCARCRDTLEVSTSAWDSLRSGWRPSCNAEVEATMSKARRRISAIDEEVVALLDRVSRLTDTKAALRRKLDHQQGLLAPIRRLPVELVMQIFDFACVDTHKDFKQKLPMILSLSSVSKLWRDIAIGMSEIWAALPVSWAQRMLDLWSKPMQRAVINRVQVYLSRVGNATVTDPLLFIIRSPPTLELFQVAMEFSDSFQVLKVLEYGFFKTFGNRSLARLEKVQGDVGVLSPPETDEHCVFMRAPRLWNLSVTNLYNLPKEHNLQFPWSQIKSLTTRCTNAYAFDALVAKCSNLRRWKHDQDDGDDFDNDDTMQIPSSPITSHLRLERLRTLVVTLDDPNDRQHTWLLDRLTTPSLNKLFIEWAEDSVPRPEEGHALYPHPCPLSTFLARTTRLRTLSLKNSNKQEQEYIFSRNAPTSIVELSVSGALGAPLATSSVVNLRARGVLPALLQLFVKDVEDVEGVWDIVRKINAERAPNDSPLFLVDVNGPLDLVPP
ncbi:uncharacterized protein SCHCODRAFT_02564665 [Schizophyllum commune H4-8]|nr:uncharacterized protein SCHCODRAFT_02564665 [Schizophyllum commune H4-8]KAI5897649.1 hypothetical protein SCHCODRAFT_02564665 [Schizophyllum commune H4-8]